MIFKIIVNVLLVYIVHSSNAESEEFHTEFNNILPTCKRYAEDLNECIRNGYQKLIPLVREGIPAVNMPRLDPLALNRLNFHYKNNLISGVLSIKNLKVLGIGDTILRKANLTIDEEALEIRGFFIIFLPRLYMEGNYKGDVDLGGLRLKPKGYFNITMTDLKLSVTSRGDLLERNNHMYINLTQFDYEPELGNSIMFATGLFPDETMNAVVLDYINQNWRQLYRQFYPETRKMWEPFVLKRFNHYVQNIPIDIAFPKE